MAPNLDAPSKKPDEQNHDDSALEAIASLAKQSTAGQATSSEDDFKLLSDGESIEVLEAAPDGLGAPAGSGSSDPEVTVKDDQLAEQNEETEILQELETQNDSGEKERIALYVDEDQRTELETSEVVIAKVETKVPAIVHEVPESFTRTPTGGVRFESSNGLEFISLGPTLPLKVSQLKFSARIFHDGMEIRLHNEGCLFLIDDSFMARVELMHAVPVLSAGHFSQAKTALFR